MVMEHVKPFVEDRIGFSLSPLNAFLYNKFLKMLQYVDFFIEIMSCGFTIAKMADMLLVCIK